ncbi:MAG TPA: sulfotransferase [Anaerolineales bacterium]|nr:sulfotransferase [Anaerolineales bacterium]
MSQDNTNKILFIAGPGRSGSTLLEMLLGQINGFYSTGELRFIWSRGFEQNQLCGCGKPFRECEFWTEVVKEAFGGYEAIDYARIEKLREAAERRVSKGLSINRESELLAPYGEYFDVCRSLYQAVHKISGSEFIIDSSKNTAHGFVLANIPEIDLFTVHLIRDSRAVAYSWRRERIRPEIYWEQKFMGQRKIMSSAIRWNSLHKLAEKLQHSSKGYARLRYEDLVNSPKKSLLGLFTDLGIEQPSLDFIDGLHANLKTSHTVSGNPVRFTNKEIKITPDVEWQHAMANRHKWLVTLITWPLLSKYGYFKDQGLKEKRGAPLLEEN